MIDSRMRVSLAAAFAALDREALIEASDTALSLQGYWKGDRRHLAEAVLRAVGLIA